MVHVGTRYSVYRFALHFSFHKFINFLLKNTFNPFVLNAPFLYPLKTLGVRSVQGLEKRCIGKKWVKTIQQISVKK